LGRPTVPEQPTDGTVQRVALDTSTIVALIGVLGFGSVIGQWFGAGRERRAARAAVLKALAAVESARWGMGEDGTANKGRSEAIRELQTAALIARIPRAVIRTYAQLATAASWASQESVNIHSDPSPEGAAIDVGLADVVRTAAEIVSDAAWLSPLIRAPWLRIRLWRLAKRSQAIKDPLSRRQIDRARGYIH
jgi:hypothetical protein